MSPRKAVVGARFEGFRRSDHARILACLTASLPCKRHRSAVEWVVWDLPGYRHLRGKGAFDGEFENDDFVGSPTLTVDRLIEEADTEVAIGNGETTHRSGELHRFAFCDVFTFAGDAISRVESYLVPLTGGD